MSTALALNTINTHTIDMWQNESKLREIRTMVSPSTPLSDMEFSFLVELGRATHLNPFMKEIWAVKYQKNTPAQIFIGRDGYRKTAQRQPDYEYHQVNAVYSKDTFNIINQEIQHTYGFSDRGELMGAYCIVKRKSSSRYTYVMVTMSEYNQHQGLWTKKPETMIKKVAEAQALRQAFQEVLTGTYSDAEMPEYTPQPALHAIQGNTQTDKLNSVLGNDVTDGDTIQGSPDVPASEEQIFVIEQLLEQKQLPQHRIDKAFEIYKITDLLQLTDAQARRFIFQLEKA